jgi:AcrR family transcriptional regulator
MKPLKTFQNLSADKQERITSAAAEEFSEKGYGGASINAIVDKLGIAKGSIFQYFGDKKGLFLFVFDSAMKMVKNYLRTVRDQTSDEELFIRLEKTLLAGEKFLREHPVIYKLYLKIMFESGIPFKNEILLSLREYSLEYFKLLLEDAKKRGELREDIDLAKAAFVLDAIMDRFLQARTVSHLDAGQGLYQCKESSALEWVKHLTKIMRFGIGA